MKNETVADGEVAIVETRALFYYHPASFPLGLQIL